MTPVSSRSVAGSAISTRRQSAQYRYRRSSTEGLRSSCPTAVAPGGGPRLDAIPRDVTVRRAERLAEAHPEGLYDLFGYNCEQAANFCSTNSYESYQVRGYFAGRSFIGIPVTLYVAARNHDRRSFSRVSIIGLAVWVMSGPRTDRALPSPGRPIHEESGAPALGVGAQSTDVKHP